MKNVWKALEKKEDNRFEENISQENLSGFDYSDPNLSDYEKLFWHQNRSA
jgi:hypothetical protein